MTFRLRVVGPAAGAGFRVGAAPGVDRLVVVADRGEGIARPAGQQLQQAVLAAVGVLVFVDQQVAQLALPALPATSSLSLNSLTGRRIRSSKSTA
jgi:hypothetical protein